MSASTTIRAVMMAAAGLALACASVLVWLVGWGWPNALLAAAAVAIGLHIGIIGLEFALCAWIGRGHLLPKSAQLYERGSLGSAWVNEILVSLRTFIWAVPFSGTGPLPDCRPGRAVPVVLVHGFMDNRGVFKPLARWLAARGHPLDAPNLEPLAGPMDCFAAQIHATVECLRERTGASQVALIGHSMGGLAIRAYLRDYGHDAVSTVITLGSPHQGTWLGRLAHSAAARELNLGSAWLADLASREPTNIGELFTIIISLHDNMIAPQTTQSLPGARLIAFTGYGHLELLYRKDVWEVIGAALRQQTPHASDRDDRIPLQGPGPHRGWTTPASR